MIQTDRQTDRRTDGQTDRQTDRLTDGQTDVQTDHQRVAIDKLTDRLTDRQASICSFRGVYNANQYRHMEGKRSIKKDLTLICLYDCYCSLQILMNVMEPFLNAI